MQIDTLRDDLQKQIETLREQICSGFPKSYEEYRAQVGQLRGLEIARAMTLPRPKEEPNVSE